MLERNRALTIRVADEELAMLNDLAESDGVTQSDYVRLRIRRDHAERFGDKKPKRKK